MSFINFESIPTKANCLFFLKSIKQKSMQKFKKTQHTYECQTTLSIVPPTSKKL